MLEVAKPAAEYGIQIGDNAGETIPACALALDPNTIAYGVETLPPHPALPRLEVIAQEVEALAFLPTIPDMGFVGIKTQGISLYPSLHFGECRLCLLSTGARRREVIGVTHHLITLLLHLTVQRMQVNVSQKRTNTAPCVVPRLA